MTTENIEAAREGTLFLSGAAGRGILIVGMHALPDGGAAIRSAYEAGYKSHKNNVLWALDGVAGEIRLNKAETAWVIDLASPRRQVMFVWGNHPNGQGRALRHAGPRLETTNGGAWCIGIVNCQVAIDRAWTTDKAGATLDFIAAAMKCLAERGMTPTQAAKADAEASQTASQRQGKIYAAAVAAGKANGVTVFSNPSYGSDSNTEYIRAAENIAGTTGEVPEDLAQQVRAHFARTQQLAEEARIMAELEAEQAALVAAQQAAAAAERQARENAIAGVTAAMTPKQARIAIHNARMAGKI